MVVVVGLIIAFVLVAIFARRGMRMCRWRMDKTQDRDGLRFFRCAACGAEDWTDGAPPRHCLRPRPPR
jgi:hypothetical protein